MKSVVATVKSSCLIVTLSCFVLSLLACGNDSAQTATSTPNAGDDWLSPIGEVPLFKQRAGDAEKGRAALLTQPYVNCGIPERVFRSFQASENIAVVEAPDRDATMAGLPYFTTRVIGRSGIPVVSNNCLTCHASSLFGQLVIGLGNEFADFTNDPSNAVERAGIFVKEGDETTEWEIYADRIAAIAPYIQTQTVGVNPANNLTFALIAHRDRKTHQWLDEPVLPLPPTDPPPVSVPPWWRMKKKHALFNLSEGRDDHSRLMLAASLLCADSIDELNAIDAYAADIRAYIASLEPPEYPFVIDAELAERGRSVFNSSCADCHGRYDDQSHYPNLVVDIGIVGTDSRLLELATGPLGKQYAQWFNESWFGERSRAAPARGYIAPPLDGIWATAPFLHNGSVPNLRAVLDSSSRPTYWRHRAQHSSDPNLYDQTNLGWSHERVPSGVSDTYVYDTTRPGYANSGHPFGDGLTGSERSAVLEYLKTL